MLLSFPEPGLACTKDNHVDLTVALEARFTVTPDGRVWTGFGMGRKFWARYLDVFDRVHIVARQVQVGGVPQTDWMQVNSDRVLLHPVPDYLGPFQYLLRQPAIRHSMSAAAQREGAVILRVGSQVGACLEGYLRRQGRPYALEVLGDPYDVFAPGAVRHPLRPLFRFWFSRQLRMQCERAVAVAYVTQDALQRRYPARGMNVGVSDVRLQEACALAQSDHGISPAEQDSVSIAPCARKSRPDGPYTLVFIGSLAQMYKGPDVLVDSIAHCVSRGLDVSVILIGEGKCRPKLEALVARRGLHERVRFAGQVPAGQPVYRMLDSADLFVLPSRTEGLPRAMIEAMARALPCIGSTAGGIPELLPPEDMVPPGNVMALAAKIEEVLRDPRRLERMSTRNLEKARGYREDLLHGRRQEFYRYVRDVTENWNREQNRSGGKGDH